MAGTPNFIPTSVEMVGLQCCVIQIGLPSTLHSIVLSIFPSFHFDCQSFIALTFGVVSALTCIKHWIVPRPEEMED
jgi:hypothetical protein